MNQRPKFKTLKPWNQVRVGGVFQDISVGDEFLEKTSKAHLATES